MSKEKRLMDEGVGVGSIDFKPFPSSSLTLDIYETREATANSISYRIDFVLCVIYRPSNIYLQVRKQIRKCTISTLTRFVLPI